MTGILNFWRKSSKKKLTFCYFSAKGQELFVILGIIVDKEDEILDSDIEALIAERQAARKEKNFARADEIRDILKEKGITLKDTPQGVQVIRG